MARQYGPGIIPQLARPAGFIEVDVGDVENRCPSDLVLTPDVIDVPAGILPNSLPRLLEQRFTLTKDGVTKMYLTVMLYDEGVALDDTAWFKKPDRLDELVASSTSSDDLLCTLGFAASTAYIDAEKVIEACPENLRPVARSLVEKMMKITAGKIANERGIKMTP